MNWADWRVIASDEKSLAMEPSTPGSSPIESSHAERRLRRTDTSFSVAARPNASCTRSSWSADRPCGVPPRPISMASSKRIESPPAAEVRSYVSPTVITSQPPLTSPMRSASGPGRRRRR